MAEGLFLPFSVTLGQSSLLTGLCLGRSEVLLNVKETECTLEDWVHQSVSIFKLSFSGYGISDFLLSSCETGR